MLQPVAPPSVLGLFGFAIAITLIGGAALLAIGYLTGSSTWLHVGGYVLFADSISAFYVGTALMFRAAFGRVVLPTGEPKAAANIPGRGITHPLEFELGEPGVRQGQ